MQGMFLAMYQDKVSIFEALFISIFAMIIVFFVLLIISYMIDITAFVLNVKNKTNKNVASISNEPNKNEVSETKKNDDLVAVIAASIAAYLGVSVDNIRISKIRRVNQTR